MASSEPLGSRSPRAETRDVRFERLFSEYVDRMNSGETIDREKVLAENPDLGRELLLEISIFQEITAVGKTGGALGALGDFKLVRQVGRGGMGTVYEAMQGAMERRVALKVLRSSLPADQKAVMRFLREAKVAGRLQHTHIVPVYQMGVEAGTPYYAME